MDERNTLQEEIPTSERLRKEGERYTENAPLFRTIDAEDFKEMYDTRKLFLGLRKHLSFILLCMGIFALFGLYATYMFLNTYKADAVVLYQGEKSASKELEGGLTITNLTLATVIDMIKQPKNLENVRAILGLDLAPKEIAGMIQVQTPKNNSSLIRIVAKGDNPNLVIDIANTLAKVAVKTTQEFTQNQLKMALANYQTQAAIVRQTLASQIQDIENFKTTHQYLEMEPEHSIFLTQLEDSRKSRDVANVEYDTHLIQYENLKREMESLPEYVPISMESGGSPLGSEIVSLKTSIAEARAKYAEENPKLKQLEQRLNELLQDSKSNLKVDDNKFYEKNPKRETLEMELVHLQGKVHSAQKVKEDSSEKMSELEENLTMLPVQQMAFVKLLQVKDITFDQLKFISKAIESAQIMTHIPKGSLDLYQFTTEAKPWKSGLFVELLPLLGLFFGIGVGLVVSIFLETQDSKLRTSKQIGMLYSVPCIGTIPEFPKLDNKNGKKRTLFFVRDLAEHIDKTIKTKNIVGGASITLTSSTSQEGKSCISYYLANYYSMLGKKVLLVEFDYRKNSFVEIPENQTPLINYLKGKAELEEVIAPGKPDRIGIIENDPTMKELVKSEKMSDLWKTVKGKYDLIIIDAPGVIEDDYATNLAALTDLCLLVVGSSLVKKSTIDETLRVLDFSGTKPWGILLNRIDPIYIDNERIKLETKKALQI
ncbi:MAG: putative tyrosine-protein kinase YveL [Chlamydiae bacterium]|nr:putative tyrosine-protein kinase YveL [Chlamydiota bacterium]